MWWIVSRRIWKRPPVFSRCRLQTSWITPNMRPFRSACPNCPASPLREDFRAIIPPEPVGHLIGYVGIASAEDYEKSKDPLLITPGFNVGKDGLERAFNDRLTAKPGAKAVEVPHRGQNMRETTPPPD